MERVSGRRHHAVARVERLGPFVRRMHEEGSSADLFVCLERPEHRVPKEELSKPCSLGRHIDREPRKKNTRDRVSWLALHHSFRSFRGLHAGRSEGVVAHDFARILHNVSSRKSSRLVLKSKVLEEEIEGVLPAVKGTDVVRLI